MSVDPAAGDGARPGERAAVAFRSRFGRPTSLGFQAPGRVNLIGEHTDYNAGLVLPIAINRRCVAVGAARAGSNPQIRVFAEGCAPVEFDTAVPLDPAAVRARLPSWAWFVAGVADLVRRRVGRSPAMDIAIATSVPLGAGLSSSASLEVAVAGLLLRTAGVDLPPTEVALLCQAAEHRFAGVPCGIMDQLASVCGRPGHALVIDCRVHSVTPVPMPPDARILVINTNVRHNLAAGEYAARRAACGSAAAALGLRSLRDATLDHLRFHDNRLSDEQARCARHVITEIARTAAAADILRSASTVADLAPLGPLFAASHASLRDDFRVSCPELDAAVEIAAAAPGVLAARMTGGGFGGCAIALVGSVHAQAAAACIVSEYNRQAATFCEVFQTGAADGAGPVDPGLPLGDTSTV